MRNWFLAMIGGLVLSTVVGLGAAAQQSEIQGTIDTQIEAFKVDDFATAFSFATPSLQRQFRSPENFRRMVTQGYPMVWRPAEVQYLELRELGGSLWQKVQITDGKGFTHLLDYKMVQIDDGWRIGAVVMLDPPAATA